MPFASGILHRSQMRHSKSRLVQLARWIVGSLSCTDEDLGFGAAYMLWSSNESDLHDAFMQDPAMMCNALDKLRRCGYLDADIVAAMLARALAFARPTSPFGRHVAQMLASLPLDRAIAVYALLRRWFAIEDLRAWMQNSGTEAPSCAQIFQSLETDAQEEGDLDRQMIAALTKCSERELLNLLRACTNLNGAYARMIVDRLRTPQVLQEAQAICTARRQHQAAEAARQRMDQLLQLIEQASAQSGSPAPQGLQVAAGNISPPLSVLQNSFSTSAASAPMRDRGWDEEASLER